ncbi:MOSC N-terminal beta barrel domain-containing protein [Cellulomonas soli]
MSSRPDPARTFVAALAVHPVKSLRGVPVEAAHVRPEGLAGDRRWMLVDPAGDTLTARRVPQMLTMRATPRDGGGVLLERDGAAPSRSTSRTRAGTPRSP